VATTHTELMCRAKRRGIAVQTIHASSSPTSVVGECGLHHYKMGRMATIMRDQASMISPYYIIYKNSIESEHTLLMLEYDREGTEYGDGKSFFLDPAAALKGQAATESGQRRRVLLDHTYAIVASRVGFGDQHIIAGTVSSLVGRRGGFGDPPHTIIIPGRLHFTEVEALEVLAECIDPPPPTSSESGTRVPRRIADQMVEKYAPLIRRSIEEARESCTGDARLIDILDNAGRYVSDAEDFVKKDGHADVAVLSIGYADGLVDALRQVSDIGFRGES